MFFIDRIQKNPRLIRLKNLTTQTTTDYEIQDLAPSEIQQEGTEVNASVLNTAFGEKTDSSSFALLTGIIPGSSLEDQIQSVDVNYPTGFTSLNCVCISSMAKSTSDDVYSTFEGRVSVDLLTNRIVIDFSGAWGVDMDYKIVLMKVS